MGPLTDFGDGAKLEVRIGKARSPDPVLLHGCKTQEIIRQMMVTFSAEVLCMAKNRNGNRLRTRRWVDAPLRELSGICLRRDRNRRRFQVAIGDREAKIAWFLLPDDEDADNEWRISDISNLPGSMLPAHDPQIDAVLWEA